MILNIVWDNDSTRLNIVKGLTKIATMFNELRKTGKECPSFEFPMNFTVVLGIVFRER
jgi:hypothetical protein